MHSQGFTKFQTEALYINHLRIGETCETFFLILKNTLIEKEIIEEKEDSITLADPVFELWFKQEYM